MPLYKKPRGYKAAKKPYSQKLVYRPASITNLARGLSSSGKRFGVPNVFTTRLRYVDNLATTLSTTPGIVSKYVFRLNSIFDPDFTGTGHKPMYHNQLVNLYNKYVVLGARAKVTFTQIADDGGMTDYGPIVCGILKEENGATAITNITEFQENNESQYKFLTRPDGGARPFTLSTNYSPVYDLGRGPDDDTVGATVGANPTLVEFLTVYFANVGNGGGSGITVTWNIEIEFLVKLSHQKENTGS